MHLALHDGRAVPLKVAVLAYQQHVCSKDLRKSVVARKVSEKALAHVHVEAETPERIVVVEDLVVSLGVQEAVAGIPIGKSRGYMSGPKGLIRMGAFLGDAKISGVTAGPAMRRRLVSLGGCGLCTMAATCEATSGSLTGVLVARGDTFLITWK